MYLLSKLSFFVRLDALQTSIVFKEKVPVVAATFPPVSLTHFQKYPPSYVRS